MKARVKKTTFEERRKGWQKSIRSWLIPLLILLVLSQTLMQMNQRNIHWLKGRYSDVTLSDSGDRIVVVDAKTGLAGALDMDGKVVIPIENSVFDPWTGALIDGLKQSGNLFWTIQDNKVGIVNQKNEVVIPREYGYLEKSQEDQFIAGTGQISSAAGNGVYTYQKYGVITESGKTLIPLEYDSLRLMIDGRYEGSIEEDTRTIHRTFYSSGNLEFEEIIEKGSAASDETGEEPTEDAGAEDGAAVNEGTPEAETIGSPETENREEGSGDAGETDPGGGTGEPGASGEDGQDGEQPEEPSQEPAGEDTGIQDYEGPGQSDVINIFTEGYGTRIHLSGTACTLEDPYGNVLAEFEGDRVEAAMPAFAQKDQLVLDEGEEFYRVYQASTGTLLADVKKESECIITPHLIAYEQGDDYIIKNYNNTEIFRTARGKDDQFLNSPKEEARFIFKESYFAYQGEEGRTLITNSGVVIAEGLSSISFNDENNDKESAEDKIFICERDGSYGAFNAIGDRILDFAYENIEFFNGHESGLRVTEDQGHVGIVDYGGEVIIPLEYESVGYGSYIEEADDTAIVEYELLNTKGDSYYGKKGDSIFYLDDEGKKTEEVRYVKSTESGRDLNDFLSGRQTQEAPQEYRTTGNILIMDNAYSGGWGFGRSAIYKDVEKNRIRFLLFDEKNGRMGVAEYYYGDFTLMGYQHWFWYGWLLCSRLFAILLLAYLILRIPYEDISDWFYFWRKRRGKKRKERPHAKKAQRTTDSSRSSAAARSVGGISDTERI